jgi:hypothetical protein
MHLRPENLYDGFRLDIFTYHLESLLLDILLTEQRRIAIDSTPGWRVAVVNARYATGAALADVAAGHAG